MLERCVLMGARSKEKLLEEMAGVQRILEERIQVQGEMVKDYKLLLTNEGLFSQIIDLFPYPIAIFTPQYTVVTANKAFVAETKELAESPEKEVDCILKYRIDDTQLASAITRVFSGDTFYLEGLENPFSMFPGIAKRSASASGYYSRAVVFPVPADDDEITHGVIVFMP